MKTFALIVLSLIFATPAFAQPVVFSRETITIIPAKEVKVLKEESTEEDDAKDKKEKKKEPPLVERAPHAFKVDVRAAENMNTEGLFLQSPFKDDEGLIISYDPPRVATVVNANIYEPVDVLYVREDGTIVQIVNSINLSAYPEVEQYENPLRAMLYIKGGTSEALDIRPGDWIKNPMFIRKPEVKKTEEKKD